MERKILGKGIAWITIQKYSNRSRSYYHVKSCSPSFPDSEIRSYYHVMCGRIVWRDSHIRSDCHASFLFVVKIFERCASWMTPQESSFKWSLIWHGTKPRKSCDDPARWLSQTSTPCLTCLCMHKSGLLSLEAVTRDLSDTHDCSLRFEGRSDVSGRINVRDAFKGRSGRLLLAADYVQCEVRVLAHYSKDTKVGAARWQMLWPFDDDDISGKVFAFSWRPCFRWYWHVSIWRCFRWCFLVSMMTIFWMMLARFNFKDTKVGDTMWMMIKNCAVAMQISDVVCWKHACRCEMPDLCVDTCRASSKYSHICWRHYRSGSDWSKGHIVE